MCEDESIKFELFEASTLVCNNPCWVYSIIIAEDDAVGAKALKVYDGFSSTDKLKVVLYAWSYIAPVLVLQKPIRFEKGLYLEFGTNLNYAMIQYRPDY